MCKTPCRLEQGKRLVNVNVKLIGEDIVRVVLNVETQKFLVCINGALLENSECDSEQTAFAYAETYLQLLNMFIMTYIKQELS